MSTFNVVFTDQAIKDLKRLDKPVILKARDAIQQLSENLEVGHLLRGSLRGVRALEFSAPGGAFRAAYVADGLDCIVFAIGPHERFYEMAVRRFSSLRNRHQ